MGQLQLDGGQEVAPGGSDSGRDSGYDGGFDDGGDGFPNNDDMEHDHDPGTPGIVCVDF